MLRVATVGCRAVLTWPVPPSAADPRPWEADDRALHQALRARGAVVEFPSWDDPEVDWSRFDVALIRATWDYHHRRDTFLAWAERAAAHTRLVNPLEIVQWNTDKRYLRDLAVPQVETIWLDAGAQLPALSWPVAFLKPAIGATAERTLRFRTDPDGLATARAHLDAQPGQAFLLQPYVAAVETAGERSAIAIDGEITHFVRKQPLPGDYRVQDDYGATDGPHTPSSAEEQFARLVLDAIGTRLPYARIDWLLLSTGPALVELELVEPCLFFRHGGHAADRLAAAVMGTSG